MKRVNVSQNLHVFQTLSVKAFPNEDLQEKQSQNLDGQLIFLTSGCEIVREITDKDIFEKPKGFCWPWKSKLLIVCFHNWVSQRKWWGIPWQHPLWYYISIKTDFVRMEDMWPWWMILNLKECGKCYIKKWKIKFFCYWNWEKAVGDYIRGWWRWYVGKEYTWHRYKWETLCFCLNLNLLCGEGPKGRYGENSQLKLGKEKDFWNIERMFRNVILVELIIGDWKVSRLFKHIKTWRHQTDELF